MANFPLPLTFDARGNLQCDDVIGAGAGDTITWSIDPSLGSISSITNAGTVNVLTTANPTKNSNVQYQATVASGKGGQQESYTIWVQPSGVGVQPKSRTPKISVKAK
jgi:hypothetical protein